MSVGQLAGGLIGGAIGWSLSGNPFLGAQLGMMVGGYLDPPKTPTQEGPRVSDLTTQTSTYGAVIPRIYGTDAVAGNIIWLENNKIKETATKNKSSGKGGGRKTSTRTYTYSATFAVGLCKGPIVGIRRMWVGPDLVYDAGSSDPATITASNQSAVGWTLYVGSNTQGADPRMQATLGVANTPAYRGLAYLVFEDFALAKYGNSLAGVQVRAEVMMASTPSSWSAVAATLPSTLQWKTMAASTSAAVVFSGDSTSTAARTTDGITWSAVSLPVSPYNRYGAAWGENIFLVMAEGIGCDKSTDDGLTWTRITSGFTDWVANPVNAYPPYSGSNYSDMTYGGGKFCAVTSGWYTAVTDDGTNWRRGTMPASRDWNAVAHNGTVFCAIAGASNRAAISADGLSWTENPMAGTSSVTGGGIAFGLGLFVVMGFSGGLACQTSPDGITWTSRPVYGGNFYEVRYGGGFFFAPDYGANVAAVSLDGINWTTTAMPSAGNWRACAPFLGGIAVAAFNSTKAAMIYTARTGAGQPLSDVVSPECLQSGLLTAGDIDVTSLTPQVRGYSIGTVGTIRSALEPLQAAWPFDIRQHGYKVQFLLRPGTSVVTIPSADLDARSGETGVMITTQRVPDTQLPAKVLVRHKDYDRDYNQGEQYASRLTVQSFNSQVLDIAIVLTSDEAAGKAETLLYLYWLERHDVAFTLPGTYNQLEAGDVVTLSTPEGALSLRLIGVNNTSDGRVECKARYNSPAIYTPTAIGAPSAVSGPTTIIPVGASVYALLDVPMISSAQSTPSFLAAMTGELSGWQGGTLMQSTDSGSTWASLQDFDPPGSVMGTCSNSIGVVDSRVTDNASVLSVTMTQGSLYSVTQAAMFSGSNMFAYGADGRWEIMSVQVCTLVSGSSYTLKDMLRGQYGTEWAMGLHVNGDALILLDTIDTALIAMGSGMIGLSWLYRGITAYQDISTDANRTFTYRGVNLMPLSPVNLTGSIDPSTFDWTLSLIPRTRENAAWKDSIDAPIGELSQSYQIDIFSSGAYTTLKRTISSSSATAIPYSSADQVTDFGSNQNTLYLKVYQLSSTVGRGYPLTVTITR